MDRVPSERTEFSAEGDFAPPFPKNSLASWLPDAKPATFGYRKIQRIRTARSIASKSRSTSITSSFIIEPTKSAASLFPCHAREAMMIQMYESEEARSETRWALFRAVESFEGRERGNHPGERERDESAYRPADPYAL